MTLARCWRAWLGRARADDDRGLSIIELVVAMAVFSGLMVVVGGAMLNGFSGMRDSLERSEQQSSAQLAAEWVGKLLRYTGLPEGQTTAIVEASPTSITVFTYSGTGEKHDVPYRARLFVTTEANGERTLSSEVITPRQVSGGWTWTAAPETRDLLTLPADASAPLAVGVWVRNPAALPATAARNATPTTTGPIALLEGEVVESVVVQIGNQAEPRSLVTLQVRPGSGT
jgi:prepilin-type N-terminal cleavage/methylation domain-containing protein